MVLYIIGNGFDLAHNLHTNYSYFRDFVIEKGNKGTFEFMQETFKLDQDWRNFEEALAHPKEESKTIDRLGYSESVKNEIQDLFNKWILKTDDVSNKPKLASFKADSIFLNFNYTSVLEMLYDIPFERVCHIHRHSADQLFFSKDCDLVFGHGEKPLHALDYSLKACLYKDVEAYFAKSKPFFKKWLHRVDKVVIIGFSYSFIDIYYFERIKEMAPLAKWYCGFYSDKDKLNAHVFMNKLGIHPSALKTNTELMKGKF